ncbi:MAG: hypothetical protein GX997_03220 [Bacteroidales bacterium]|nr:hypothetical protein [Bacteroidales bacterium]
MKKNNYIITQTAMIKKIFAKDIQYLMAFILYLFSVSCQGPLEGEKIEFITPNVYKDLSPEATQIVMRTEKSNWTFQDVQYNDTIADLSTGKFYKINHDEDITDTSFSYETKKVNNKWVTEITGSFFSITSESPENKNEPTVITVDITENTSKEKKVLLVQLINLDTGSYFRIEQNPK